MKKIILIAFAGLLAFGVGTTTSCKKHPAVYTVTFNSQGGSSVRPQTVEKGQRAQKPNDPAREEHIFDGWARDAQGTQPWDFAVDAVVKDTTLYAQWVSEEDIRGELEVAIQLSAVYKEADYTSASWAPFAVALAEAKSVRADGNANIDTIGTALDNLLNAAEDLVPVGTAYTI